MHVDRMDEYRMARKVLMTDLSWGPVRGRQRLGWMDGVKVALCSRGMTVEAACQLLLLLLLLKKIGNARPGEED